MTPKQQSFVRNVASGNSYAEAYRTAYNAEQMKPNSVRREAHRLMKNPNVTTMVDELKREADQKIIAQRVATREEVLTKITEYMSTGEPRDAVKLKAAEIMGKHYGLFTDKVEINPPRRTVNEIEIELNGLLGRVLEVPIDANIGPSCDNDSN